MHFWDPVAANFHEGQNNVRIKCWNYPSDHVIRRHYSCGPNFIPIRLGNFPTGLRTVGVFWTVLSHFAARADYFLVTFSCLASSRFGLIFVAILIGLVLDGLHRRGQSIIWIAPVSID